MLSVIAGTPLANDNKIIIRFEDRFPMGTPAEAAHWFLDIVRTWQPEYAMVSTSLTNRTYMGDGNYASYLSWVSAKAFGGAPEVESAIRIPFGDGNLYAAREWTVDGVGRFIEDLRKAGATSIFNKPRFQDPPIPRGLPRWAGTPG